MSILSSMLRNLAGSSQKPGAASSGTPSSGSASSGPAAPSARQAPPAYTAAVPGTPQQLSPDRIYSLDTTDPVDYEPGFDIDYASASLTDIADHFKTDKGNIKHRYTEVYARYFEELRDKPLALMEIGVACGSSLKTWARYFPRAKVLGVDIRPECSTLCKAYPQIDIRIADATTLALDERFDIVIDDGSHVSLDIVQAFVHLWEKVKPGGYFVIEDLRCTHDDNYRRNFSFPKDPQAFDRGHFMQMVDACLRSMDNASTDIDFMHFYRQMVVVRKKL